MASFSKNDSSGLWSVRFRIIEDNKEVNKRLSGFETKKKANEAFVDFMASYVAPPKVNQNYDLTVKQLYGLYKEYIKARLKESSQYEIDHCYLNHIEPMFGAKKINKIDKSNILSWQNDLNNKGYKYKFKSKLRGFLSTLLKFGMRYYDLPFNPVQSVEPFRNIEPEKVLRVWSETEFKTFYNAIDKDITYKTFFLFLYLTGCRKGEALAATWKDIDLSLKTLSINKSLTRKTTNGMPYSITTPKNKTSNRKILIPNTLINQLIEYKNCVNFKEDDFLFCGSTPLADNTVDRKLKQYCELAHITPLTPHGFRHSHASLLINKGESIVMVSKRLGHANIEQTLNTYSHLMPNQESEMVEKLEIF